MKKETLAQVFSCEFCENFKNTFLKEHLLETATGMSCKVFAAIGNGNSLRVLYLGRIYRKKPFMGLLFSNAVDHRPAILLLKDSIAVIFAKL